MTHYRSDIDGLRAIAILAVIGFHCFPVLCQGGYVGVDIFFAISGFLITSIILRDVNTGTFTFLNFYIRRIRRIFPSLITLLFFCLVSGWFLFFDYEYMNLARYASATAGFAANFLAWHDSGYFEAAAKSKPLLHMWSLGVEEQFYFVWPVLIWLVSKRKFSQVAVCAAVALVSFVLYHFFIRSQPNLAFYFPVTRMWQLTAGSFLAALTFASTKKTEGYAIPGVILLLFALVTPGIENYVRGGRSLLATAGAVLLLINSNSFFHQKILSNRILVWIGLISYPLYLWHWTLLSYVHILTGSTPEISVRLAVVALSFVIAWLTYQFIEKPFRFGSRAGLKAIVLCYLLVAAGAFAFFVFRNDGISDRRANEGSGSSILNSQEGYLFSEECLGDTRISKPLQQFCSAVYSNNAGRPTIVLWGDSSSYAWRPVFFQIAKTFDFSVIVISHQSCLPLIGIRRSQYPEGRSYCSDINFGSTIVDTIKKINPQMIFLLGAWNFPVADFEESITASPTGAASGESTLHALRSQIPKTIFELEAIAKLVVFRSWPRLWGNPFYRSRYWQQGAALKLKSYAQHKHESRVVDEIFNGVNSKNAIFFDPSTVICDEFCRFEVAGRHVYRDLYHVTPQGSLLLEPQLSAILQELK